VKIVMAPVVLLLVLALHRLWLLHLHQPQGGASVEPQKAQTRQKWTAETPEVTPQKRNRPWLSSSSIELALDKQRRMRPVCDNNK